jgi:hypothetical protein
MLRSVARVSLTTSAACLRDADAKRMAGTDDIGSQEGHNVRGAIEIGGQSAFLTRVSLDFNQSRRPM